ncbi:hypothetical protein [Sorangium sp. So ce117]|uniref:hypothetical protein n=1 Tax=Sorangium sp. So ce117 TaxID=3133277 RepID=UPI003F61FCC2
MPHASKDAAVTPQPAGARACRALGRGAPCALLAARRALYPAAIIGRPELGSLGEGAAADIGSLWSTDDEAAGRSTQRRKGAKKEIFSLRLCAFAPLR